jgi:hypothetical protein
MNLKGATRGHVAFYKNAGVEPVPCFRRDGKVLPMAGPNQLIFSLLERDSDATAFTEGAHKYVLANPRRFPNAQGSMQYTLECLENLISQGWVTASVNPARPFLVFQ